ncbi:MAG: hypothetical protein KC422_20355 [Trueperaceae bacterium]|nr:hypothetical protein [Trueperaceae bacterium]
MTRLIVVGGFLGAGKTTLLLQAANQLKAQGLKVGLITNDQGNGLVDTALLKQHGFTVSEVAGGCFCCRFPDLLKALAEVKELSQPDFILAEPVGSCTDLAATVLLPLKKYYPDLELAPLSIVFDPTRATTGFNANVQYLFAQQLAEAQIIVLNKMDVLDSLQQQKALDYLRQYARAKLVYLSALAGEGIDTWLEMVSNTIYAAPNLLDIDYDRYGSAEASLGWLNARGVVSSSEVFSPLGWLENVFAQLTKTCTQVEAPIAHIKMQVRAASQVYKASLTGQNAKPSWDIRSEDILVKELNFILNARVGTSAQNLEELVLYALEASKPHSGGRFYLTEFECFEPKAPEPSYRFF